jgi:hypothetical protein
MNTQTTLRIEAMNAHRLRMDAIKARTEKLSASIVAKARETAKQAGLSPDICFLHAHNALCSFEYGHPWPEVNYSLARKVKWLERQSWEPSRLYDRIWRRSYNRMLDSIGATDRRYDLES